MREEISRELELAKERRERGNKFETCLLANLTINLTTNFQNLIKVIIKSHLNS